MAIEKLTEVYVTSDGKFHRDYNSAAEHERRRRVENAVAHAINSARFHKFGEYQYNSSWSLTKPDYVAELIKNLKAAGLDFKDL